MLKLTEPFNAPAAGWAEIFAGIDERRLLLAQLSPLELAVVAHVGEGLTNREIAARMRKTEPTVKRHLSACFKKLRVPNRARLIAFLR